MNHESSTSLSSEAERELPAAEKTGPDEVVSKLRRAWREKLAGQPVCLNLPFDRPRQATATTPVARFPLAYSADLVREINQVAESLQLTTFVLLETTLALVLGQLVHSRDVLIGTTTEHCGETTGGPADRLIHTIVLPHGVQGAASVLAHWQQGAETLHWALEHGQLPFAELVAAVNPPRSVLHAPLFQVFCDLQAVRFDGTFSVAASGAGADLAIVFQQGPGSLLADVSYNTELFEAATAEAIVSLHQAFLSQALHAPEASVESIWLASLTAAGATSHQAALERMLRHPPAQMGAWYGLSPAQEAVWLESQAAPKGSSYQAVGMMRCTPPPDSARLEAAVQGLIAQHQSWWLEWNDQGLQRQSPTPMTRVVHKFSAAIIDPEAQRQAVLQWHREQIDEADEKCGTVAIFHWPDSTLIVFRVPHVMHDGWSSIRYYEHLARNYALLEKNPAHRFEMERHYLDTLKAEQAYLDSPKFVQDEQFWRNACSQLPSAPLIGALADRPHATENRHQVGSVFRTLSPTLQEGLRQVAERGRFRWQSA